MVSNIVAQIIFFVFAISAVVSALMVVTAKNPMKGILSLVLTFVAMAGVWIFLHAEFLALILVVVYVGAVMTLFLFVVMTLRLRASNLRYGVVRYLPFGIVIVLLIMVMLFYVVGPAHFGLVNYPAPGVQPADYSNVSALGLTLYTREVYSFEVAGVILLVAMIAAITLAFRGPRQRKSTDINSQLTADPKTRVKLVNMKTENKPKDEE